MNTVTPEQCRKFNRTMNVVGLFGLIYFALCVFLFDLAGRHFDITKLHPVLAVGLIFAGVSIFFVPFWWVCNRLRRRFGLVCTTCGAWLSFRKSAAGECHRCSRKILDH